MNQAVRFFWFLLVAIFIRGYSNAQVAVPKEYPTTTRINYVRSWNAVKPDNNTNNFSTSSGLQHSFMSTSYFDGLGRPLQTVIKKGSLETDPGNPTSSTVATDVVNPVIYDDMGRQAYKYLPFVANNAAGNPSLNDGVFKLNAFQQQAAFMQQQYGTQGETYFYGKTNFDGSPLNRPEKVMEPGNSWVGSSRGTELKFWINTANDAVRIWTVTDNPGSFGSYNSTATYAAGDLFKNIRVDEHGKQVIEFKDKEGQVILKKIQLTASADNGTGSGHVDWLCTYYIYDELNNLRCVIQPEGVKAIQSTWSLTTTLLNEQCFRYEYDERGRMIEKKIPGAGVVYMVYDPWDRLVLTQDGNQRPNSHYVMTKYDVLNRPVVSGIYTYGGTITDLRNLAKTYAPYRFEERLESGGTGTGYTSRCWPEGNYEVLSSTYYDDYGWLASQGNPFGSNRNTADDGIFPQPDNNVFPYRQPMIQSFQTKGMITGTKTKVLGTSQYLYGIVYYDDKGRPIQSISHNLTGGPVVITNQYSFSGQLLCSYQMTGNNQANQAVGVFTKNEYDDLGRLLNVRKTVYTSFGVSSPEKLLVQNEYDKLGQLKKKKLAPGYNSGAGLESLTYDYNIRGWMLGMNRDYAKDANSTNYFGFDLGYDKTSNGIIGNQAYNNAQYNGNIAGMVWKSKGDGEKRKYDFSYDAVNRLMKADFTQYTGGTFNQNAGVNYDMKMGDGVNPSSAYDLNGNILRMQQWGLKLGGSVQIDDMSYSYYTNTNKLLAVTEQGTGTTDHKLGDFTDKNTTATDYGYDLNGNLITDLNKGLNGATGSNVDASGGQGAIRYNHLNLPTEIVVTGKGMIYYTYDATGNKLKKQVVENATAANGNISTTTTTTYLGGLVYESKTDNNPNTTDYTDRLQFIGHEEGRIRFKPAEGAMAASFQFDYMVKDHLGNVRMVLTEEQKADDYFASMEVARRTVEEALFTNIGNTESDLPAGYPADTYTNPNVKVAKVRGDGQKVGPGVMLKVMAGDKFNLRVNSWYKLNGSTPQAPTGFINDLLFMLSYGVQQATGGHTTQSDLQNSGILTPGANDFLGTQSDYLTGRPKAFVNWVLFDEQFKYVASNSGTEQVGADQIFTTHLRNDLPVSKNGYLYIYVSNETPNISVFFDNLQVTHTRGAMLEETHYYPFGLTMAGISSKALSFGSPQNKYKYNGGNELQSGEFNDGSGLELFDAVNRLYDPQIGRFWQVDELAEANWEESPYSFAHNDPFLFNDPLGLDPEKGLTPETAKELENVTVVGVKGGFWAKQRFYYRMMDYLNSKGATIGQIVNNSTREMMYRFDGITKHRDRVVEMTWESDRIFMKVSWEIGSFFIPVSWLTKAKYAKYAAKLFKWKRGKAAAKVTEEVAEQVVAHGDEAVKTGENVVYHSVEDGVTQYVGITNNFARREAEHLASKGIKIEPLMQGLSRADARAVEQALIEVHGLGKNGGTLLNKINSIAQSNPTYSAQLERGYELLKSIGYK